jgi:hypothetical protein
VRCDGDRCVHAHDVLVNAGAADVREEASAGPT